ncbi:MAG TPA: hypothetical protein DCF68_22470, partial [Cyanothece sp. UBA12306]|nr:hypothetical protein [Cyanothece sp. UBA12306]
DYQGLLPGIFDNQLMLGLLPNDGLLSVKARNAVGSGLNSDSTEVFNASKSLEQDSQLFEEERARRLKDSRFDSFNGNGYARSPSNLGVGGGGTFGNTQAFAENGSSDDQLNASVQGVQTPTIVETAPTQTQTEGVEVDTITGIPRNQGLISLVTDDNNTRLSSVEQQNSGTQLSNLQQVPTPELATEENLTTASNLASVETTPLSLESDLSNGGGLTLDLPEFPTAFLEAKFQQSSQNVNATANSVIPIFELKGVGVDNADMTFIFDQNFLEDPNNSANQKFFLKSNDPINGERSATID